MKNIKKIKIFLTLIFISTFFNTHAQIAGKSIIALRQEKPYTPSLINAFSINYTVSITHFLQNRINISPLAHRQSDIPNFHRYEYLPFFCKIEVKLEQTIRLPFKFRLGEVGYVDRLEGKRGEY